MAKRRQKWQGKPQFFVAKARGGGLEQKLSPAICHKALSLHVTTNFFCSPVFCPKLVLHLNPFPFLYLFQNVQVYPAVFLICFISAALILLASPASMVQFSLLYNRAGLAIVLYNSILPTLINVLQQRKTGLFW